MVIAASVSMTACEEYLDKSPDLGLDESVIYGSYEAIRGYIDECYPLVWRWNMSETDGMNRCMNPMACTDELASSISQNNFVVNQFNMGNWYSATRNSNWEVGVNDPTSINKSYRTIRIANRVISGIDKVKNCTDEQKNEILGQAYFYRAWFYFQLVTRYGGMPKLDRIFNGGDDNVPRMTARESFDWMMEDLDKAIAMLPDMWDAKNYSRPDKAAARGVKAEALLYAASPLFQNGLNETKKMPYDKDLCLAAAKAAQETLDYIASTETGRRFVSSVDMSGSVLDLHTIENDYHRIFVTPSTTFNSEEYLWWDRRQMSAQEQANTIRKYWQPIMFDKNTGQDAQAFAGPTANIVSLYERKGPDGNYYPIYDSRSGYQFTAEAAAVPDKDKWKYDAGVWSNMQNRDPRFYHNILLPGQRWGMLIGHENYIDTWKGAITYNKIKDGNLSSVREFSGFLCSKYMWPEASYLYYTTADNNDGYYLYRLRSFYIRVTEMYLNYAEALFEATGSATSKPDGFNWTPVEALDIVRARVGVTPVAAEYTTSDTFRETYRREREVEMMFENHRWIDIRRWMIFDELWPSTTELYNVTWTCDQAEIQNPANPDNVWQVIRDNYSDGADLTFSYTLQKNSVEVRVFNQNGTMKYYLYPFPGAEIGSLSNLKQNPGW